MKTLLVSRTLYSAIDPCSLRECQRNADRSRPQRPERETERERERERNMDRDTNQNDRSRVCVTRYLRVTGSQSENRAAIGDARSRCSLAKRS